MPHFLQCCPRISDLWDSLYIKLLAVVPGLPSGWELLMLFFPVCSASVESLVVAHLGVLVAELWETRTFLGPPFRADLVASLRAPFLAIQLSF